MYVEKHHDADGIVLTYSEDRAEYLLNHGDRLGVFAQDYGRLHIVTLGVVPYKNINRNVKYVSYYINSRTRTGTTDKDLTTSRLRFFDVADDLVISRSATITYIHETLRGRFERSERHT